MEADCSRIAWDTELIRWSAPLKQAAPRILLSVLGWMSDSAARYRVRRTRGQIKPGLREDRFIGCDAEARQTEV
jgi:hypothetical protein